MADQTRNLSSRVAGVFQASNYATWSIRITGGPYPLASPATLTLTEGVICLRDGRYIVPFAVGATVGVGSGANAESVTVTAFANCALGLPNDTATLTGNTANAHGQGDQVVSNSGGLFEACADALALGGGVVVVDKSCTATSAQITAAQSLYPTLSIQVETGSGSQTLQSQTVLTSAQLKALQTTAITVVGAPGTGRAVIPVGVVLQYKFLTTTYTIANSDNAFQFEYVGKTTALVSSAATGLVDQASSDIIAVAPAVAGQVIAQTNVTGLGIEVKLVGTTAALTVGLGSLTVTMNYLVVNLT